MRPQRHPKDTLRRLDRVGDNPSVSEHAALDLAVYLADGASVVSWRLQVIASRYVRLWGWEAALERMGLK